MINYIIIFILVGIFSCCNKSVSPIEPPVDETIVFDLKWATKMDENKEIVGTDNTQHFGDWVLVGGDLDDPFTLFAFDKNSGTKEWTLIHNDEIIDEIDISYIYNHIYLACTSSNIIGIDLHTQNVLWEIDFASLGKVRGYEFIEFEDQIFLNLGDLENGAQLIQINPQTGDYDVLYTAEKSISPITFKTNDSNELIAIFNSYLNNNLSPEETTQTIIAFNINIGVEIWRKEYFTDNYASNVLHPPIIHNDIVITGGDWSIYAFDINTGQQLWRYQVPGYDKFGIWTTTNHLIHNDRLYVNPGGHPIICLNPFDGSVIWENLEDAPNCTDNMIYYDKEDYLVYTSWGLGSIMIIDALTGELVHRERSEDSTYNNDPVYDPETDMFFTSTYKHAIGFKINRPE